MSRALLPFIFVLILIFQALNMQGYAGIESKNLEYIIPADPIKEREISHNNSGIDYRDGIVDNFKNFTILNFPIGYYNSCKKLSNDVI